MTDNSEVRRPRRCDKYESQPRSQRRKGSANQHNGRASGSHYASTGYSGSSVTSGKRDRAAAKLAHRGQRWKKIVLIAVVVVLIAAGGALAYGYSLYHKIDVAIHEGSSDTTASVTATAEPEAGEPFTILLLGDDSRPGETMARSDTMIVARVDPVSGEVWMLSIPRDTRVDIPGYGENKINAATAYGGADLAVETVEDLLGIDINYYMTVNFTGFVEAVDALGGVYVEVDEEINDKSAASHSENCSAYHIDAGYQLLDGEHALTFVRARHQYVDQDFSRMRNQQKFFKALADQVKSSANVLKIPSMVTALADHITTNMSLTKIIDTALALKDSGGDNIYTATITGEWENPYVWPDEENMADLVARMEAGVSFDDTSTVAALEPSDISVSVRNGAGVSGIAAAAGSMLSGAGFNVAEVGNASQMNYAQTLIVYDEDSGDGLARAQAVKDALSVGELTPANGEYSLSTDVLVVVGADWETVAASQ